MNELLDRDTIEDSELISIQDGPGVAPNEPSDPLPATVEECLEAANLIGRLAVVLNDPGRLAEAEALLGRTVVRFPESDMAAIQYAWTATRSARWAIALARWDAMLNRFPNHWAAMSGRGEALRELGRLDEADSVLAEATRLHADNFMPFAQRAQVAARRGDWEEALRRWEYLQQRFPSVEHGPAGVIEALTELGRLDEAERAAVAAEAQFPAGALIGNVRTALNRRFAVPKTAVERVRQKIRESRIEAVLPRNVADPEVLIEITSICNFACTYCVSPMKLREKKQMSLETFRDVMEQVATITTKPVGLHIDGEPTTHPQFKEMALIVNSHGLLVRLATNGSNLDPTFLDIWMDPLISMSTSVDELAKRHNKLNFESYISRIANYADAWARSRARQNLFFQIVHYPQANPEAEKAYKQAKNDFLVEFCRRAGLYESCIEETAVTADAYRLRRKGHPGILTFIKQVLSGGGLYPVDSKLVERPRATAGFCDSPWRLLVVHSNGTLGACCNDLSGGTSFATAEDVAGKSIKELWESSPRIQRLRQSFLNGEVELDVCQRCLTHEHVAIRDKHAVD